MKNFSAIQAGSKLGREHKLVVFPGGDHGLNTNRPERNRLIFEWFEKHLN